MSHTCVKNNMHASQKLAINGVPFCFGVGHSPAMTSKKAKTGFKRLRKVHFRAWRLKRGMTLDDAAEAIGEYLREHGLATGYTATTLSRVECGGIGYTEMTLEAMAYVYQTDSASLITREPEESEGLWGIWSRMSKSDRRKIVEIAKAIVTD